MPNAVQVRKGMARLKFGARILRVRDVIVEWDDVLKKALHPLERE